MAAEAELSIFHSLGSPSGLFIAALSFVCVLFFYYSCLFAYNIWLHPLSKYPGPYLAAATPWWVASSLIRGKLPFDIHELHKKYGPVVRTSPEEISYINPAQWKEIYGLRAQGQEELPKDKKYFSGLKGDPIILNADRHYHGYVRKLLSHGFSEKSLRAQEPILIEHVNKLFRKLHEEGQNGHKPLNLLDWYNFMAFDFIGFLTFGETFDCLSSSSLHPWVKIFFSMAKSLAFSQSLSRLPYLLRPAIALWVIPKDLRKQLQMLKTLNAEKIRYRIGKESEVPDFMAKLIDAYSSGKMTYQQLEGNAQILIGAGSETTATLLSGLTYLLLTNPKALEKLTQEVRTTFASPEEINLSSVNGCKYLLACIEEALRVYPPSPVPHHRIAPRNGVVVNGELIPEGMSVSIPIYAIAHSALNWTEPDCYIPERWTGEDSRFASDRRDASQPFSHGPRNCIGRNLAYSEIKLVISRLVWSFDLENATEYDWLDQQVFVVWEKKPLWVKLHPAKRG